MSDSSGNNNEEELHEGAMKRGLEATKDQIQALSDKFRSLPKDERYNREVGRERRKAGRNRERDDEMLRNILKTERSVEKHGVLGGKAIKRMLTGKNTNEENDLQEVSDDLRSRAYAERASRLQKTMGAHGAVEKGKEKENAMHSRKLLGQMDSAAGKDPKKNADRIYKAMQAGGAARAAVKKAKGLDVHGRPMSGSESKEKNLGEMKKPSKDTYRRIVNRALDPDDERTTRSASDYAKRGAKEHGKKFGKELKKQYDPKDFTRPWDFNEGAFDATKRTVRNKFNQMLDDPDMAHDALYGGVKGAVKTTAKSIAGTTGALVKGLATDARRGVRKLFGKRKTNEDMYNDDNLTKSIIESISNQNMSKADIKEMVYTALSEKINDRLDECKAVVAESYFGQHDGYFSEQK